MTGLAQGEGARKKWKFFEPAELVLKETFAEVDKKTGSQLVIFDGTSNQKMVILAWMIDMLKKDLETLTRRESNVEQTAVSTIRNNILGLLAKILEQASQITGSTSLLSEDDRKSFIERYAQVVDSYHRDIEEALKIPSITLSRSRLWKESQGFELPPLPKGSLLDITTFLRNIRLENNSFPETEEKGHRKTLGFSDGTRRTVQMTPINGVKNSRYVSPKEKGINIHKDAYADETNQETCIPYVVHLNDTYEEVVYGVPKNITYLGAKYPDGSSLSYLPIKNVTVLRRQSEIKLPSRDEGGVVELRIPRKSYERIKTMCTLAYLEKNSDHCIRYPQEIETGSESIVIHALARGYRRLRIIDSKKIYHITLLTALESCSHDLTGDALLHLRFDKHNSEEKNTTMKIVFFGLQMVRNTKNHFQKIFRI